MRKVVELYGKVTELVERETQLVDDVDERMHRAEAIAANKNVTRRVGAQAVHNAAPFFAGAVKRRAAAIYEQNGLTYIDGGAHSSVVRAHNSDRVVKMIRRSRFESQSSRDDRAVELRELIEAARTCHEDEVLSTDVDPAFRLKRGRREVSYVALLQSYIEGHDALDELRARHDVQQFAERSLDVMVPQGLAPDVLGKNNLLFDPIEERTTLVDAVPMVAHDPLLQQGGGYERNLKRLRELAIK